MPNFCKFQPPQGEDLQLATVYFILTDNLWVFQTVLQTKKAFGKQHLWELAVLIL